MNQTAMISAHRCGAGQRIDLENTRTALSCALDLDVEFIEFDVQRCADGICVLCHDDVILIGDELRPLASTPFVAFAAHANQYLCYDEVLTALAKAGKRAHIDLKFTSPLEAYADPETTYEVQAVRQAVEIMGASQIIVTSLDDRSVRAVRDWARKTGVDLLVGLSIGRSLTGLTPLRAARQVLSEVFPARRYRRADANLVVAQWRLARLSSARFARRRRLPLLVWTVDDPAELRYWLKPGRAWLVTTNEPSRALHLREVLT